MKIQKNMFIVIFLSVMMLTGIGVATAQDEPEMTDQQFCEKQAKDAGLENEQDVSTYVTKCLAEIEASKSDFKN